MRKNAGKSNYSNYYYSTKQFISLNSIKNKRTLVLSLFCFDK